MTRNYKVLTTEDVDFFMENGYVIIHDCFGDEFANLVLKDIWVRLGMDPNDKSTWLFEKSFPPEEFGPGMYEWTIPNTLSSTYHRKFDPREWAPKAWDAVCDLVGGEERIDMENSMWTDKLVVNLGRDEYENNWTPPDPSKRFHIDGDYFLHFLDSVEQGLLVTPIYSEEVKHQGGGTAVFADGWKKVTRMLADNPQGLLPQDLHITDIAQTSKKLIEVTGKRGDVLICHPHTVHAGSKNALRIPRFINNPVVSLKEPFKFNRPKEELSLVEQATLNNLGKESFDFKPTGNRVMIFPVEKYLSRERMRLKERERLEAHYAKQKQNGVAVNGISTKATKVALSYPYGDTPHILPNASDGRLISASN
ncbi:hypothetical protein D0Z07_8076 [Hyphodiscus hymeniophilus]|uniref:Phytanoyl-CoA dioxygenase n=1 Tax=Hyphodiscus hymeniophilus TaxID=353542 RepID=A0A9P6VE56_9HELO|nr:hypothetical protein D0Z07_8076 [Hyphodiscus hymeniophilus]